MNLTVEKFLKDGHLFQEGDKFENSDGKVWVVSDDGDSVGELLPEEANYLVPSNNERVVIKARCLMLPRYFRLYQDMDDGLVIVVNKKVNKYTWAQSKSKSIKLAMDRLNIGYGSDVSRLAALNLVPIISLAQLGE